MILILLKLRLPNISIVERKFIRFKFPDRSTVIKKDYTESKVSMNVNVEKNIRRFTRNYQFLSVRKPESYNHKASEEPVDRSSTDVTVLPVKSQYSFPPNHRKLL